MPTAEQLYDRCAQILAGRHLSTVFDPREIVVTSLEGRSNLQTAQRIRREARRLFARPPYVKAEQIYDDYSW
jgi:hypothetical protein